MAYDQNQFVIFQVILKNDRYMLLLEEIRDFFIEFEDGLQLVSTNWLKGSSEYFWPMREHNIKRLHKNIMLL